MTNSGVSEQEKQEQEPVGLELMEEFMVLAVPTETVELMITARIYHDGELMTVNRTMSLGDIRDAFADAARNYIPDDAVFSLTPLGEEDLERLKAKHNMEDEE